MPADLRERVLDALADIDRRAAACRELFNDRERHGDNDLANVARAKAGAYENAATIMRAAMGER
jgi:hypothetical protein